MGVAMGMVDRQRLPRKKETVTEQHRYTPTEVMILDHGMVPVVAAIAHPPGKHSGIIRQDLCAIELRTAYNRSRWFGCARAYINEELRMVAVDPAPAFLHTWKPVPVDRQSP